MAVISKDLGPITAYAAAGNRGYTGTRAEFEELMASYATVAQEAGESASAAADSASDAESSASAAATSASDASSSASAANTSAGNASNAATAAGIAQTAAESARDAAQSAQTAAEAAQEGAEAAVDGFDNAVTQAISDVNAAGTNQKELAKRQAEKSEAWAVGKISGEDVGVSDPAYHNNAKYYAESAGTSATTATTKAGEAAQSAANAAASASAAAESARTLTIDNTLTKAGQAADAKAVGDQIGGLNDDLEEITGPGKNLLYYYNWTPSGASITLNGDDITITATSASTYRGVYVDVPVNDSNFMVLSYLSKSASVESATSASIRYGSVVDGTNKWRGYITSSPAVINTSNITTLRLMLYVDQIKVVLGDYAVFTQLQLEYGDSAGSFSSKSLNAVDDILRAKVTVLTNEIPLMLADSISTVGENKYNPDTRVAGFINTNTGTINPNTDYFTSDFIDVSEFTRGYAFTPKARKILFYDEYKNAIQNSYHTDETAAGVLPLDNSYKYIRLSWYRSSSDVMVADASEIPTYEPYEIVAKNGINYLNSDTKEKINRMIGSHGKHTELAAFLNGKTVAVFGDSIMYGAGNDAKGPADLLAEKYNMTLAKYCVSGATMGVRTDDPQYTVDEAHHIAKQVRDAISAGIAPDLIIFDGGTNDIGGSIPIGTMTEVYTQPSSESYFADGFETVAYLLTKNFVGVPIVYMRAHNMSSRTYQGQVDYGELGNSIAEKWGIETVDMYKQMNTQLAEYRTAYLADYTHPNEAGYNKYYIPAIENFVFSKLV